MNILTIGCGINLVLLLAISGSMAKPQERAGPSNLDTKLPVPQSQSQNGKTNAETIYINTDSANFKDQVQRLTGKQNTLNRKRKQPAAITGPVGEKSNHARFGIVGKPAAANHNDASHRAEEPNWQHQAQSAAEAPTLGQRLHNFKQDLSASEFDDELDKIAVEKKLKIDQEPYWQHQAQSAAVAHAIRQQYHDYEKDLLASGSHEELDQMPAQKKRKLEKIHDVFENVLHQLPTKEQQNNGFMGAPVQGGSSGFNEQQQGTFGTFEGKSANPIELQNQQQRGLQRQPQLTQQYVHQQMKIGGERSSHSGVGEPAFQKPSGATAAIGGKATNEPIIKYDIPPRVIHVPNHEFMQTVQRLTGNKLAWENDHQHVDDMPHVQGPQAAGIQNTGNYGMEDMGQNMTNKPLHERRPKFDFNNDLKINERQKFAFPQVTGYQLAAVNGHQHMPVHMPPAQVWNSNKPIVAK